MILTPPNQEEPTECPVIPLFQSKWYHFTQISALIITKLEWRFWQNFKVPSTKSRPRKANRLSKNWKFAANHSTFATESWEFWQQIKPVFALIRCKQLYWPIHTFNIVHNKIYYLSPTIFSACVFMSLNFSMHSFLTSKIFDNLVWKN